VDQKGVLEIMLIDDKSESYEINFTSEQIEHFEKYGFIPGKMVIRKINTSKLKVHVPIINQNIKYVELNLMKSQIDNLNPEDDKYEI